MNILGEIKPEEYKKKLYDNASMPAPQKKVELTEEEKKALKEQAKQEFKNQELRKLEEKRAKEEAKAKEEALKKAEAEKKRIEAEKIAKAKAKEEAYKTSPLSSIFETLPILVLSWSFCPYTGSS